MTKNNTDPTTKCDGCGIETFVGERIRHAGGCQVAAALSAAKRLRMEAARCPRIERAQALTQCSDPALAAALHKDFANHDK